MQTKEMAMLRRLKETAVDIRKRFFATSGRREELEENDDHLTIESGNKGVHAGDACLDISLFSNHIVKCDDSFATLYCLSWHEAESLRGMFSVPQHPVRPSLGPDWTDGTAGKGAQEGLVSWHPSRRQPGKDRRGLQVSQVTQFSG